MNSYKIDIPQTGKNVNCLYLKNYHQLPCVRQISTTHY